MDGDVEMTVCNPIKVSSDETPHQMLEFKAKPNGVGGGW